MIKWTIILCAVWLLTGASHAIASTPENDPDKLFRAGLKKYAKEQYQDGVNLLSSALTNMPSPAAFDVSLIHYNLGIGYYRLSQPEQAAKSFSAALLTSNIELQEKAYFNLGNTLFQSAQQALNEGDIAKAFRSFQSAQTNFMQTMRLNSMDHDAKVNFELSVLAQMNILRIVAEAMTRLQQGDQLVGDHKFVEAAQWFQENLPMAEKALSVEPDKQKLFKTMAERSAGVAGIVAPPPSKELAP